MFLSAPLPGKEHKIQLVAFLPSPLNPINPAGYTPRLYAVKVPVEGSIKDLKIALAPMCSARATALVVVDVFGSRAYRVLYDHYSVAEIQSHDQIFVYDLA